MKELAHIPLFSTLSESELALIPQYSAVRQFKKNTIIITEGDITDSLYVILEGRVKVYLTDEDGKEFIINDLEPPAYFGELAILDGGERSASVITTEDCKFLVITREAIYQLIQNPDTALKLIRDLSQRVKDLSASVKNLALNDVYKRLVHLLMDLVIEEDGVQITKVPLTQEEIAKRVGAARESIARIMNTIKKGGYISYRGKRIVIERKLPAEF